MKKIMILGAGIYQVPLINAAKKENYYTIVVSIPGNYPGFKLADQIAYIDTTNCEAIYALAKQEKIDAIVTTGTDVALITVGYVCDKLGLKGISYKAARLATDKALMKKAFEKNGVRSAKYFTVYSFDDAKLSAQKIGYPVMIKIVDKSGSRGITKVENELELVEAYEFGKKNTKADYMIVEKCIQAREIGVDAFVQNGKLKFFFPHDKLVHKTNRTCIPKGHICPLELSSELYDELYSQTVLAIEALSLNNCAVNMDVFITDDNKVFVIEATGRCGATGIPEIISTYAGIDYYNAILDNSLGKEVNFDNTNALNNTVASILLFSKKSGILEDIVFDNKLVVEVSLDYCKGQFIKKAENGTDRIGMAIIQSESNTSLLNKINDFEDSVKITVHDCK